MSLNRLAYYANRVVITQGLQHQSALLNLRNYIKMTPEKDLLRDVKETHRSEQLRAMWEAGLNAALQQAVLAREEELVERRR